VDFAHAQDERVHGAPDGGARRGCGEWTFRVVLVVNALLVGYGETR
jgi:hypothetical protein